MIKKIVVFIHGAWVTPLCWEKFIPFFEAKGFQCLAPSWPCDERPISELRASPDPELAKVGISEIVSHYEKIIRVLPHPPILIGHSFGGLFVQMLLDRGLGIAGIAIDSAPPKGVLSIYWSVIKNISWILRTPGGQHKVLSIPFKEFRNAFVHTLAPNDQKEIYQRQAVPTPGRVFFQVASAPLNEVSRVNFLNPSRAPLLLIAGSADQICPAVQIRDNFSKYKHTPAVTEYKEFENRTHWIIAQDGWEEVASACRDWADRHA